MMCEIRYPEITKKTSTPGLPFLPICPHPCDKATIIIAIPRSPFISSLNYKCGEIAVVVVLMLY